MTRVGTLVDLEGAPAQATTCVFWDVAMFNLDWMHLSLAQQQSESACSVWHQLPASPAGDSRAAPLRQRSGQTSEAETFQARDPRLEAKPSFMAITLAGVCRMIQEGLFPTPNSQFPLFAGAVAGAARDLDQSR